VLPGFQSRHRRQLAPQTEQTLASNSKKFAEAMITKSPVDRVERTTITRLWLHFFKQPAEGHRLPVRAAEAICSAVGLLPSQLDSNYLNGAKLTPEAHALLQ